MVSAVTTRPTHYETLGLTPEASDEEIARAFARELSRPRAFGGLAEVGLAYETLRDPDKRRTYDASLGLNAEPETHPSPAALWEGTPYLLRASAHPAEQFAIDPLPRPVPPASPQRRPEPAARPGSFIASALREPVNPGPRHDAPPGPMRQPQDPRSPQATPQAAEKPDPEYLIGSNRNVDRAEDILLSDAGRPSIAWRRTVVAVGGLVLAVGLLGAWAGLEAGGDAEVQQPERAVTLALPRAKVLPRAVSPSPAPAPWLDEARPEPRTHAAVIARQIGRVHVRPRPIPEAQDSAAAQPAQSQPGEIATEQAVTEAAPVAAVAASLPLSNAVIARTIGRIGYPCGRVASTTAVEGEARGVFKVTCSSGHSYRAAPVGARYHFKRWAGR